MARKRLTQDQLRQRMHYDPETGVFTWRAGAYKGKRAGFIYGTPTGQRFRHVRIEGRFYRTARLAFLYMQNRTLDPKRESVNHRDGDPTNDAWSNLEVTAQHRASGPRRNGKPGTGVSYHRKSGRWRAAITIGGRNVELGTSLNKYEAIAMRIGAERALAALA